MKNERFEPSAQGKRAAKNVKHIPDSQVDLSDIPETTEAELTRMRRVGRPARGSAQSLLAIRFSPRLVIQLRTMAAKQEVL